MSHMNPEVDDQKPVAAADDQPGRGRRRWAVGGVCAAILAAAVGVALWSPDLGGDQTGPPAQPRDQTETAALAAAEGLAAAFAAHDATGAAPYMTPGTEAPWPEWRVHMQRDAAWNIEYLMEPCTKTAGSAVTIVVSCPYAFHVLGSRELGKGPFRDNTLTVNVTDGKVTSAHNHIPFNANGVGEHLDSVFAWLGANHPENNAFLSKDEPEVKPAEWPRWTQLWKQYTQEYVAATKGTG